jgi:hypothetical protein
MSIYVCYQCAQNRGLEDAWRNAESIRFNKCELCHVGKQIRPVSLPDLNRVKTVRTEALCSCGKILIFDRTVSGTPVFKPCLCKVHEVNSFIANYIRTVEKGGS